MSHLLSSKIPIKCRHIVKTVDVQPSVAGALLVIVHGDVQFESDQPLKFVEMFHLIQEGQTYWLHNDIFRLCIG
jgi:hypothetical protein